MDERPGGAVYRGNLTKLIAKIRDERGLDLAQYRPRYVERRIAARLHMLNLHTYRQYADYIDGHQDEYARFLDTLTINVTQFFRDAPVFERFRQEIVPEVLEDKRRKHQRMIRVWSAGCATGQEPYSLAMSFMSALDEAGERERVALLVIGTDIDPRALEFAKRAEYPLEQLAHIPSEDQARYLDIGETSFRIRTELARHVRFQTLDLFKDRPIHVADVVFCRNVFIYFNRDEQDRMLEVFRGSLARGGYLVLGRSERLGTAFSDRYETLSGRERIYRRLYSAG